jgi:S1-C subfamily serine protease
VCVIQSLGLDSVQSKALLALLNRTGSGGRICSLAVIALMLSLPGNLRAQTRMAGATKVHVSPPPSASDKPKPSAQDAKESGAQAPEEDSDVSVELAKREVPAHEGPNVLPTGTTDVHSSGESTWTGGLYNKTRESIVLVRAGESEGTGFVFLNNRTIATAFHVIEGAAFPEVVLSNGDEITAKVIAWDEDWDLAILELPAPIPAAPLHVVTEGQVSVGDLVATIGNPWGAEQRKLPNSTAPVWALSHGIISAPPGDLIQTDAPVNPGNSGGPLLTTSGRVVGVLVVRVEGSDGISFAVGAKHLIELAARIGQQPAYEVAAWHVDAEAYWLPLGEYSLSGLSLGLRVVHASGLGVAVRGGRLWGTRVVESVLSHHRRNRWLGEAELRYYLADSESFSLAVGAGVALSWDAVKTYTTSIDDAGQLSEQTRHVSQDMLRGLFGVSLDTEVVSLHAGLYALGGDTGGRLGIGFVF